jgi:hypothetical protein
LKGEPYQEDLTWEIERRFGSEFVYENVNGNSAISRAPAPQPRPSKYRNHRAGT